MRSFAFKLSIFGGLLAVVTGAALRSESARVEKIERKLDDSNNDALCVLCDICNAGGGDTDLCGDLIGSIACAFCPSDDDDGGDDDGGVDPDTGTDVCFSEMATVQVLRMDQTETVISVKDLIIGDRIWTGMNQYETVYAFGHYNPARMAEFYQIYSDNESNTASPLEITGDHQVFLHNHKVPVAAATLQVGDLLRGSTGAPSQVTQITKVVRRGIYAPLTTGGSLVVNGVVASSYIRLGDRESRLLSDHALVHVALSPLRMVCTGVSAQLCHPQFYDHNGMPHYVRYGLDLLFWMKSCSALLQAIVLAVVVTVTGAFWSVELVLGASVAPLMAFVAVLAYTTYQKRSKTKKL